MSLPRGKGRHLARWLAFACAGAPAAPLAALPPEQTLLDGAFGSNYGRSISIDGNRMAIGAALERVSDTVPSGGAVHVYARTGNHWVREARLVASQATNSTQLGRHVALSADRIIASAGPDTAGNTGAYVFSRAAGTWQQDTKLFPSSTIGLYDVAVSGTTAALSGFITGTGAEVVFVFVRDATSWSLQQQITPPNGDECGREIALSGDRLLVGCPYAARGALQFAGNALVYRRQGTVWSLETTLLAADPTANQRFGWSVAASDLDALVGAPGTATSTFVAQRGSAYFFLRNGTSWSQGQKLQPTDGIVGDNAGIAVAFGGDFATIGSPFLGLNGGAPTQAGAAHAFVRTAGTWNEVAKVVEDTPERGSYFGFTVASATDASIVGAYVSTLNGTSDGAAFHYTRSAATAGSGSSTAGNADDQRGTSIATAGDFMFVGAPNVEVGANIDQGIVTVYEKVAGSWVERQTLTPPDGIRGDKFGTAVATNANGGTLVVGAPGVDAPPNFEVGTGFIYERVGSAWLESTRILGTDGHNGRTGLSVAVSDDGATVAIGSPLGNQARGMVLVYTRAAGPPTAKGTSNWQYGGGYGRPSGARVGDKWGASIALEGTMLAVGAPGAANASGDAHHGLVQVLRTSSGVPHTVELRDTKVATPDQTRFGTSVAFDGTDLAVGAPDNDVASGPTMNLDQGVVETYTVSAGGTATPQQTVAAPTGRIGDKFGAAIASDSGVLVIGAPLADAAPSGPPVDGQGIVHVFRANRPPGGLVRWFEDIALTVPPSNPAAGDAFGSAVAIRAGTLAFGAPRRDFLQSGPKQSALVRDVGQGFAMPYVANFVFVDGFE